ncbi:MAG TPA: hypothetical protein VJ417_13260, partial [Candidatus Glassbacteria bacterium]|nr:hypothetical protein [Candidatus Glassbacteria bacterium]
DYLFVEVIDVADDGVAAGEVSLAAVDSTGALQISLPAGTLTLAGEPDSRTEVSFRAAALDPPGDYDGSGAVDVNDVFRLLRLARDEPQNPFIDFNADGRYSILDAVALLVMILKG